MKACFDRLVNAEVLRPESEINGTKVSLDRRVSTRWNSELACIDSHLYLYSIVQQLISIQELKLQSFLLTEEQLQLTRDLREVLMVSVFTICFLYIINFSKILEEPTKIFSRAEVPLIADVIPMMFDVQQALINASNDASLPDVLRIAAHAGVIVCEKYLALTDECEAYWIAIGKLNIMSYYLSLPLLSCYCTQKIGKHPIPSNIYTNFFCIVMSPNMKLDWFYKQGFSYDHILRIRNLVVLRWDQSYKQFQLLSETSISRHVGQPLVSLSVFFC